MTKMTAAVARATIGGAKHPSLGGFLYYCMTGNIL
jgi:hypothetical protein